MKKKYPQTVCLDCLIQSRKDTVKLAKKKGEYVWEVSNYYSTYIFKCEVCGVTKECTEPVDFGNPNFNKQLQRLRLQKIKRIKERLLT